MALRPPPGQAPVTIITGGSALTKVPEANRINTEWLLWFQDLTNTVNNIFTSIGTNPATKTVTFANTTGTVTLFTVTGDVYVTVIPIITTDLTSVALANLRLGVTGNTAAMIVDSLSTGMDARGIWVDQTPTNEIEPLERKRGYIITDGNDIILTLDAQVDAGAIKFDCFWTPLPSSPGASVI